ncbi:NAD(P)/FAD-dependent oxidoreductase [Edaphobacter modestus]|uniref:Glycine oxidase n=1 Tax=Edaphobacter modestus TaxID=388466 RepID=A0A4Q7YZW5_9BACT|nr:FAD-dependent oxidoreductase [Edaphobacter modestus]RZU42735.1 glycine oxidase [Edaphobacter modestus]
MLSPDICIAGAGIIGLSLALELRSRGANVTVFEQGDPLAEASTAAAGMLAVSDPDNPPELRPLSRLSSELYPEFLDRLFDLSGIAVALQTSTTIQEVHTYPVEGARDLTLLGAETLSLLLPQLNGARRRFVLLEEHSLNPRELAPAVLAAVRAAKIDLRSHTPVRLIRSDPSNVEVHTASEVLRPSFVVDCTGAWGLTQLPPGHVRSLPRKGQMMALQLPGTLPLHLVLRTPDIYIVPRTTGIHAGRAIVGATVEDAGFDKTVYPGEIARLRRQAEELLPDLASATEVETWAGLRPGTSDGLPLLGQVANRHFIASGHYRNGILLAPATARVMAQMLSREKPAVDLQVFSPLRKG